MAVRNTRTRRHTSVPERSRRRSGQVSELRKRWHQAYEQAMADYGSKSQAERIAWGAIDQGGTHPAMQGAFEATQNRNPMEPSKRTGRRTRNSRVSSRTGGSSRARSRAKKAA